MKSKSCLAQRDLRDRIDRDGAGDLDAWTAAPNPSIPCFTHLPARTLSRVAPPVRRILVIAPGLLLDRPYLPLVPNSYLYPSLSQNLSPHNPSRVAPPYPNTTPSPRVHPHLSPLAQQYRFRALVPSPSLVRDPMRLSCRHGVLPYAARRLECLKRPLPIRSLRSLACFAWNAYSSLVRPAQCVKRWSDSTASINHCNRAARLGRPFLARGRGNRWSCT